MLHFLHYKSNTGSDLQIGHYTKSKYALKFILSHKVKTFKAKNGFVPPIDLACVFKILSTKVETYKVKSG